MTTYPDEFLRGIPNSNFIGGDQGPTSELFYFSESNISEGRNDEYLEQSINWRDDEGADRTLFLQKKDDGKIQFLGGAVLLCRHELDRIVNKPLHKNILSYERNELPNNKYHGNILMKKTVQKREMRKIAATIATMCIKDILPNKFLIS